MDDGTPPLGEVLPEELLELVKPELEPGERLLWASRPGVRALKKETGNFSAAVAVWAVGLVVLGVACLVGNKFTSDDRYPGVSAILLTVGVISGVASFLIILGWLSNAFSASERETLANQVYALTDQRAIIKTTDPKSLASTIHSFQRGTIKGEDLHRVQYPDGSGDVVFRKGHGLDVRFPGRGRSSPRRRTDSPFPDCLRPRSNLIIRSSPSRHPVLKGFP